MWLDPCQPSLWLDVTCSGRLPYRWFSLLLSLLVLCNICRYYNLNNTCLLDSSHLGKKPLEVGTWSASSPQHSQCLACMCVCVCVCVCCSVPSLHDPMDDSPLGSSIHGISQARILEWVAIFFFRGIFLT